MTAPKKPQDHKPAKAKGFEFEGADGKAYTLPPITEDAAMSVPGDVSYDALMNPKDFGPQARLVFTTLEACDPDPKALAALKSLPTGEMLKVGQRWMGESRGSSS